MAKNKKPTRDAAEAAVQTLLRWAGENPDREGLKDTPRRVVNAYRDWFSGYSIDPSAYLRRLYYDTCVYEPSTLSALVRQVGVGHVLMGSDWPVGEGDPIGFVTRCPELSDPVDRDAVLGQTAAALLGLA